MSFKWKQWFIDSHYIVTCPYFICTRTWAWFALNRAFVFCFMVGYKESLLFLYSSPRGNIDKNANYKRDSLLRHTYIVSMFKFLFICIWIKKNHFSSGPIRLSQYVARACPQRLMKKMSHKYQAFFFNFEQLTNSWSVNAFTFAFRCLYFVVITYFTTGYTSSEQDCCSIGDIVILWIELWNLKAGWFLERRQNVKV